ncbi:hypothetical protein AQUCO_16600001v1 [Aquilegia coerulea]|uniref:Uncharacterized protein n=1 Tax=Aquilegia coerulea TaxID=218851 RepID=A0A2G5C0R1_AQUCA|nr:hypothetical protein AQUCO_16600001v1 [Aquilegia coerulea]
MMKFKNLEHFRLFGVASSIFIVIVMTCTSDSLQHFRHFGELFLFSDWANCHSVQDLSLWPPFYDNPLGRSIRNIILFALSTNGNSVMLRVEEISNGN